MNVVATAKFYGIPVCLYDEDYIVKGTNKLYDWLIDIASTIHTFLNFLLILFGREDKQQDFPFRHVKILDTQAFTKAWVDDISDIFIE